MPDVAGNGLVDRRALLGRGMLFAGAAATGVGSSLTGAAAEPLPVDPWSMEPGAPIPAYGVPAKYENKVVRTLTNPNNEPRTSQARTPHHLLERHDHAERSAFRGGAHRLSRYRPGQAPPGDPWPGEAAAGVRPRDTCALSRW